MSTATDNERSEAGGWSAAPCSALVLDACCGSRAMWFNKEDSRTIYLDRREEECLIDTGQGNPYTITIAPDVLGDFTELPFPDESFYHVVFDPPHHTAKHFTEATSNTQKYYGILLPGWEEMLADGFRECFRVLKHGGTLVFKWGSREIPLERILALTPENPLYGHKSGKKATTHWVAFLKQNKELTKP